MNAIVPQKATDWILPIKPESEVKRASSVRLRKINANITTPSKIRSTMMVAKEADIGTFSCLFKITARSNSPARAG